MLLPVLAPEGEPGLDSLVNFRPEIGDSRVAVEKTTVTGIKNHYHTEQ